MKILQFPLAKISIFFILGIVFSKYIVSLNSILTFAVLTILILTLLIVYYKKLSWLFSYVTVLISFVIGIATCSFNNETLNPNHYIHSINKLNSDTNFEVTILEKLKNSTTNYRYKVLINKINNEPKTGKLILNIRTDSTLQNINIGAHLKLKGSIYINRKPNNDSEINVIMTFNNAPNFEFGIGLSKKVTKIKINPTCKPETDNT